jgi:hypothetical protein
MRPVGKEKDTAMSFCKYEKLVFALVLGVIVTQSANAGVWLDIQSEDENGIAVQGFNQQLNWLDRQNDLNANLDPWMGMRVFLKWGQIPYQGDRQDPDNIQYDFSNIVDLLNAAYYRDDNRRYQILLTVSDKLWIYQRNGVYRFYGGALPKFYAEDLREGDWEENARIPGDSDKYILANEDINDDDVADNLRFAVANSHTNTAPARKYSALRWNSHIYSLWLEFWRQLADFSYTENGMSKKLRDHPALYAIITPESSLAGINHKGSELNAIGYIGAQSYSDLLLAQATVMNGYFPNLPVISSINWISEDQGSEQAPYYQNLLGDELSSMNLDGNSFGWFAQDLRIDAHMGKSSYENIVYPEFNKFSRSMRYAMITGDTYKNSRFSAASVEDKASELVNFASTVDVGHLVFLNREQGQGAGVNSEIFSLISSAAANDYSFLASTKLSMVSAVVYEGANANRVAVSLSGRASNISANDFYISIEGRELSVIQGERHPTDSSRIWLTLSDRVYEGEEVVLHYYGNGTVVDDDNNGLLFGQLEVLNHTTMEQDLAPGMQNVVVYEGEHANRLALRVSEVVANVSEVGFSVSVDGHDRTILSVRAHPTDLTKIWLTLVDRVYEGDDVIVSYDGSGTVVDVGGNHLLSGRLEASNRTIKISEPALRLQSGVVYKGEHANRLALTLSKAISNVSAAGFF